MHHIMEPGSPEILRPPTQYPSPSNSPPASPSTPPPPPPPLHNSSSRSPSNQEDGRDDEDDDDDDGLVKEKLTEQAAEIKGLKAEVKKLKQCMNGVHVIGRELQKSKEENQRLKTFVKTENSISDVETKTENSVDHLTTPSSKDVADGNQDSCDERDSVSDEEEERDEEEEQSDNGDDDDDDDAPRLGDNHDNVDGLEDDSLESEDIYHESDNTPPPIRVEKRNTQKNANESSADKGQLVSENVQLREENEELKTARDAETNNNFHYVTTFEAQELPRTERQTAKEGTTEGIQPSECCKALEKEIDGLKTTVKEIKEVNHKWDAFWKGKKSDQEAKLKAKDDTIAQKDAELRRKYAELRGKDEMLAKNDEIMANKDELLAKKDEALTRKDDELFSLREAMDLERQELRSKIDELERDVENANMERETLLKEKDNLLILTKQRVDKSEGLIEELQRDLKNEVQKSDRAKKFARNLLKQKNELEEEIKRLNGTLEEKCEEQSFLKSIEPRSSRGAIVEPQYSAGLLEPARQQQRPPSPYSPPLSPTKMKIMEKEVFGEFPTQQQQQQQTATVSRKKEAGKSECRKTRAVASERQTATPSPPPPGVQEPEMSMTKEELKEQVELFREQTEAYESDFRRERQDREAVAGKLDSVKKELEKTKTKLRTVQKPPIHVQRISDKPIHKDPKRHQLAEWYRTQGVFPPPQRPGLYHNKNEHLIAHGSNGGSGKSKKRDDEKRRVVYRQEQQQPRYFEEYNEYDPEVIVDDEEQVEICRCPKHGYVPAMQPMNNLSHPKGAY